MAIWTIRGFELLLLCGNAKTSNAKNLGEVEKSSGEALKLESLMSDEGAFNTVVDAPANNDPLVKSNVVWSYINSICVVSNGVSQSMPKAEGSTVGVGAFLGLSRHA